MYKKISAASEPAYQMQRRVGDVLRTQNEDLQKDKELLQSTLKDGPKPASLSFGRSFSHVQHTRQEQTDIRKRSDSLEDRAASVIPEPTNPQLGRSCKGFSPVSSGEPSGGESRSTPQRGHATYSNPQPVLNFPNQHDRQSCSACRKSCPRRGNSGKGSRRPGPHCTNRKANMEATTVCQERSKDLHLTNEFLVQENVKQKAARIMMHDVNPETTKMLETLRALQVEIQKLSTQLKDAQQELGSLKEDGET